VLPAGASQAWQSIRLSTVRGLAAYLHGTDPSVQVPPPGLIRRGNDRATPYLYSGAGIGAVIAAAGTLRPRFRASTCQTLISLLWASGVRIGEALSSGRGDLDPGQGMLTIRDAKFGKTRLIPLHPTATAALTRYSALRDEHHPRPADPALFLSTAGRGCGTATSASRSPSSPPRPGWPRGRPAAGPGSMTSVTHTWSVPSSAGTATAPTPPP
jgi:integrase